jgi:hypothetical protein
MDFVDILLNRIDSEAELKKPTNAVVCFSSLETGKTLGTLATYFALSRPGKSAITLLHFIGQEEEAKQLKDKDGHENQIFTDIVEKDEKSKITVRTFVKNADHYVSDILQTCEEQNCNLVLVGIDNNTFPLHLWQKYTKLKSNPTNQEAFIHEQFQAEEIRTLDNVSSLLEQNRVAIGVFMDNGLTQVGKIFAPILSKADVHILTYVYQIAQKENVKVMVWDAAGIIRSDARMQKLYQFIVKKTDGLVYLWDDDKKIEEDFIKQQDLVITGIDGWGKLINAPLLWTGSLPSTLIIKDKTI